MSKPWQPSWSYFPLYLFSNQISQPLPYWTPCPATSYLFRISSSVLAIPYVSALYVQHKLTDLIHVSYTLPLLFSRIVLFTNFFFFFTSILLLLLLSLLSPLKSHSLTYLQYNKIHALLVFLPQLSVFSPFTLYYFLPFCIPFTPFNPEHRWWHLFYPYSSVFYLSLVIFYLTFILSWSLWCILSVVPTFDPFLGSWLSAHPAVHSYSCWLMNRPLDW